MLTNPLDSAPEDYAAWLGQLKGRVAATRARAARTLNRELIRLYHHIGSEIRSRQEGQSWGAKVIDRLARDLREAFPEMKGFSSSNLKYMRFFAEHCPEMKFGQRLADQLPWFYIVSLLTKVSEPSIREWYAAPLHELEREVDRLGADVAGHPRNMEVTL